MKTVLSIFLNSIFLNALVFVSVAQASDLGECPAQPSNEGSVGCSGDKERETSPSKDAEGDSTQSTKESKQKVTRVTKPRTFSGGMPGAALRVRYVVQDEEE